VDRSASMDHYFPAVLADFSALPDTLGGLGLDLQLAAVVNDDGCVAGSEPWIHQGFSSAQAQDSFQEMTTHQGSSSYQERGFMLLEAALSEENLGSGGCNEGLLRSGGGLHLVGVSDEPDASVGDWSDYVAGFQGLVDDPDHLVVHAIGGDAKGSCASPYSGFLDAMEATGGGFVSLCSEDLEADLAGLAGTMSAVTGDSAREGPYALGAAPVPESIAVSVDGADMSAGWSYDQGSNSVSFEAAVAPDAGALLEIGYALWPEDCDQSGL